METKTLILLGGAGVAYLLFSKGFSAATAVKSLEFTNPKVTFSKVGLLSSQLDMKIDFVNNSSQDISMEFFQGNVNYNGKQLSAFTFDGKGHDIVIKARATTTVPLTVIIKNLATLQTIINLVKAISGGTSISTVINIDGHFYALGLDLPVNFYWDLKTNALVSAPAKNVSGISAKKKLSLQNALQNNVRGIGTVNARLEFASNKQMENYFEGRKSPIKYFSKN